MQNRIIHHFRCRTSIAGACCLATLLVILYSASGVVAEKTSEAQRGTQDVFARYNKRVVEIEVLEAESGSKSGIGSGFFVSDEGHLITNYHVVSRLVNYPERYKARIVEQNGDKSEISVLGVDVLNDLALVNADTIPANFFRLEPVRIKQGTRLYSLGYPFDIGISIVEGTFNGYMEDSFYMRVHFTGSLNPGMSGGPTILSSGQVVGVNVATAGNQVSFIVPVRAVINLMKKTLGSSDEPSNDFLESMRTQLMTHQDEYFHEDAFELGEHVELGEYVLPTNPAPYMKCWGDANKDDKRPYDTVSHSCSSTDAIFMPSGDRTLSVRFQHRLIKSRALNRFRFFSLYSSMFTSGYSGYRGGEDEVTEFQCSTKYVESNDITFKTVFCVRGHLKAEGLYDVLFKAASLESMTTGLETSLTMNGVTFDMAVSLSERYLGEISWKK